MAIDRNNNPMVADFASTSLTTSVFFSTPVMVDKILWSSIASSVSIHLVDMDGNLIYQGISEAATLIQEDPQVLANGLRFAVMSGTYGDVSGTISNAMETGKLFVWVR